MNLGKDLPFEGEGCVAGRQSGPEAPGMPGASGGAAAAGESLGADDRATSRRRYTAEERLGFVEGYLSGSATAAAYCVEKDIFLGSLVNRLKRYEASGAAGLEDRRRRRRRSQSARHWERRSPEQKREIVEAYERSGLTQADFAKTFGISRKTLIAWLTAYRAGGPKALEPGRPGPKPGTEVTPPRGRIPAAVEAEIVRTKRRFPDFDLRRIRDLSDGAPICRNEFDGIKVDILPISDRVLGFGNRWYEEAFSLAAQFELGENISLRVIQPVYFVATKLAAFRDPSRKNHDDLLPSHDIENLLTVMIGVPKLVEQIAAGNDKVHEYIRSEIRNLLVHRDFRDLLSSQFVDLIQTTAAAEFRDRLRAMSGRRSQYQVLIRIIGDCFASHDSRMSSQSSTAGRRSGPKSTRRRRCFGVTLLPRSKGCRLERNPGTLCQGNSLAIARVDPDFRRSSIG